MSDRSLVLVLVCKLNTEAYVIIQRFYLAAVVTEVCVQRCVCRGDTRVTLLPIKPPVVIG